MEHFTTFYMGLQTRRKGQTGKMNVQEDNPVTTVEMSSPMALRITGKVVRTTTGANGQRRSVETRVRSKTYRKKGIDKPR